MTAPLDTRTRITDAAMERFLRYGYAKTTMAEIAGDCDMSAANLYRFFANKQEIVQACSQHCMQSTVDMLRDVVRRPGLNPEQKLHSFVQEILRSNHQQLSEEPHISELINAVTADKCMVREQKLEPMAALVAEILSEGNRSGVFAVDDVINTAHNILMATFPFHAPFVIMADIFTLDELCSHAEQVVNLLLQGIKARP